MSSAPASYAGVVIAAPVSLPHVRFSEHGAQWFVGAVLREVLRASGLHKGEIDGLAVASFTLAPDSVVTLTQYFDMSVRWLEQLPFGGASGVLALRRAARAVQAGDAEVIAWNGGDTNRPEGFHDLVAGFSSFTVDASYPYGAAGPNLPFALITRAYMERHGALREDFGRICIAQRHNAQHNPGALLGSRPLDMEAYLAARPVAEPLHLYDCVMPCAGGEGFLVMREERARALGLPFARILAAEELHNAFPRDPIQLRGFRTPGRGRALRARERLRHDQPRPRHVQHRGDSRGRGRMNRLSARNPVSRGLDGLPVDGTLTLQVCADCGAVQYPPRELCRACLADALAWRRVDGSADGLRRQQRGLARAVSGHGPATHATRWRSRRHQETTA